MQRKPALLIGLALAMVACGLIWRQGRQPAIKSLARAASRAVEASQRGEGPEVLNSASPSPPAVAQQADGSKAARLALVLAKLRAWEEHDEPALREGRLQELDALLNGTNVLEIVQELPSELMGYVFALPSVREKLMADPAATLDWMRAHPNTAGPQLLTFLHDWREQDPAGMRQQLADLPVGDWKESVMATASQQALSSDPAQAVAWAMQLDSGQRQTGLLKMATQEWSRSDPAAAGQWLTQVADPALQQQLAGSLAAGYAEQNPAQAVDWMLQSLPPGPVFDQSLADVTWTWALRDPESAGAWLAQIPEGTGRQMALENLVDVWGNHDPAAAVAWVESLEGPLQTEAATALLATIPKVQ